MTVAAIKRGAALAFLLAGGGLQAQAPEAPVCADPGSTLLWEVAGEGGALHLFGSIHVGKPEFYPLPEVVETAFQQAEHVVFEVNPASAGSPAMVLEIQRRGMLPAGETLADHVSPETVAKLREVLGGMGVPVEQFMAMKPWMLSLLLTSLQISREGYLSQLGVEFYLYNRKPREAEVLELESLQAQLAFLETLNAESFLRYTLDNMEPGADELNRLIAAWQCADHAALADVMFPSLEGEDPALQADMASLMATLFHARNRDMAVDIQAWAESGEGDYFVVVGAGHLIGEGSVVELLREAGLSVTPVRQAPATEGSVD